MNRLGLKLGRWFADPNRYLLSEKLEDIRRLHSEIIVETVGALAGWWQWCNRDWGRNWFIAIASVIGCLFGRAVP